MAFRLTALELALVAVQIHRMQVACTCERKVHFLFHNPQRLPATVRFRIHISLSHYIIRHHITSSRFVWIQQSIVSFQLLKSFAEPR